MTLMPVENIEKAKIRETGKANKLGDQDRAFHDWYRFILSFPPHLVRDYIHDFGLDNQSVVLDPFCGTGTTLVESKISDISSFGIEANAFTHFATAVKINWEIEPDLLWRHSCEIAKKVLDRLGKQGINDQEPFDGDVSTLPLRQLSAEQNQLILTDSISSLPLHKSLVLLECLKQHQTEKAYSYQLLALAKVLVFTLSNLRFGPEVGIGKPKTDAPVIAPWLSAVEKMTNDLRQIAPPHHTKTQAILADARVLDEILPPNSVDAVITSPPYPNEKDYTRITRLESVILGFISNKSDLRLLKKGLMRSNTRNVYKDDEDDKWQTNISSFSLFSYFKGAK